MKYFLSFVQLRYLFEVNGQEPSNLCNQRLEWEATDLQVKFERHLLHSESEMVQSETFARKDRSYGEVRQSPCSASPLSLFYRFVRTAHIAAGSPLRSAAGERVRGAQAPPGAAKLPGTKPEQREDAVSNGGMSFTRPFRLLGLLPHIVHTPDCQPVRSRALGKQKSVPCIL